jgi:hypothetical protein
LRPGATDFSDGDGGDELGIEVALVSVVGSSVEVAVDEPVDPAQLDTASPKHRTAVAGHHLAWPRLIIPAA